jgi:hypothetical protein
VSFYFISGGYWEAGEKMLHRVAMMAGRRISGKKSARSHVVAEGEQLTRVVACSADNQKASICHVKSLGVASD